MESKIVKVYSNNSKKSRLKRNKNKFQRIWDAEKQTYVKVRKTKYPVRKTNSKKDWREKNNAKALERRNAVSKNKSVPVDTTKQSVVKKPETKQQVHKEPARIHGKVDQAPKARTYKIGGINHTWDSETLRYKRVALY